MTTQTHSCHQLFVQLNEAYIKDFNTGITPPACTLVNHGMLSYLQEAYSHIIIIILLLNMLQCVPVGLALQVVLQLLTVGQFHITEVTADGDPTSRISRKVFFQCSRSATPQALIFTNNSNVSESYLSMTKTVLLFLVISGMSSPEK